MKIDLWKECLNCKDKCCKWNISNPIFVTPEEKKRFPEINKHPCIFFNKKELCDINSTKPVDCKLFPFDVMEINGNFFWMVWQVNCPVSNNKDKFEEYLKKHEQESVPKLKKYIKEYSDFRNEEFLRKYKYKILRRVKFIDKLRQ